MEVELDAALGIGWDDSLVASWVDDGGDCAVVNDDDDDSDGGAVAVDGDGGAAADDDDDDDNGEDEGEECVAEEQLGARVEYEAASSWKTDCVYSSLIFLMTCGLMGFFVIVLMKVSGSISR